MNTTSDSFQCALPVVANHIVAVGASMYSMAIPRALMEGYFNCHGFARSLLNGDWSNQIFEFPSLIAIFCISVVMAVFGLIWFIYEFLHEKTYRAENPIERYLRLSLSIILLILLLPYSFCLWLAFMSYFSVGSVLADAKDGLGERARLSGYFGKYIRSMELPTTEDSENIKKFVENFTMNLASQLGVSTPKVMQKGERSLLAKLSLKSTDIILLTQKMQNELMDLMADVMQLSDHTRFFYRNTTTLLDLEHINYELYADLLYEEFQANEQKIIMLLNIDNTLAKIQEVAEFAAIMNNLRQDLTNQMYNEFDMLRQFLRETITKNALEYTALSENLSAQLVLMQRQTPAKGDFYLRPYIHHLEVAYCAVALLTLFLICVFLERFLRRATNRTFTRYVLMSIIAVISTSVIFLCIFVIAHFLHGVVYYNYRKEINENDDFCNSATLPYCSLHSQARSLLHGDLYENITMAVTNHRKYTLTRLCGDILAYSVNPQHLLWAQELSDQSVFIEEIFRSGAMFDVVKQELNFENWYELHNMLNTHIGATKKSAQGKASSPDMLACNLNTIRNYIFEQIYKRGIIVTLIKLTQQSANLQTHLPGSNLTRLTKRVLREAQDLQDFCRIMEKLLQDMIESIIELFSKEFLAFEPTFEQLPECENLRFAALGISRGTYECIEYSLHGFHIGAFGILLLLFVILLICICLVILYEKKGTLGAIRTSSLSRMRSRDNSAAASNRGVNNAATPSIKGTRNFLEKRPTRVRFQETPTVSGGKRFKRRYFAPVQLENVRKMPLRERVQVKKRLAVPEHHTIRERRRRRRFAPYKYLQWKFDAARMRRITTEMNLESV